MPRLPRDFINGEIYHVILRGIEDEIFKDVSDYYRAIFYLYECNTVYPVVIRDRRRLRQLFKKAIRKLPTLEYEDAFSEIFAQASRKSLLVEIFAFCLMPNHIHLLLRQLVDNGISKFIQKVASGYPAYFKLKYGIKSRGHFFKDRFYAVHIKNNEQLQIVFTYIHTNPLAIIEPEWKEKGINDVKRALDFLVKYKWSSLPDYLGNKNFPSLTQRDFLIKVMGGENGCLASILNWLKYKKKREKLMKKYLLPEKI